jgi:hypothetical protein
MSDVSDTGRIGDRAMPSKHSNPISKRYPEAAALLSEEIGRFAGRYKSVFSAQRAIANRLKVSVDALDSWRRGVRRIPDDKIESISRILFFEKGKSGLTGRASEFARLLRERTEPKKAEPILSWKESTERAGFTLCVKEARYAGAGRFFSRLFLPFLGAACIEPSEPKRRKLNFEELLGEVWLGEVDVGLGILATPRFNRQVSFLNSPINYRLNCVVPSARLEKFGGMAKLRVLLSKRRSKKRSKVVMPVVMRGEIGEAYAQQNLDLGKVRYATGLQAREFCTSLDEYMKGGGGRLPVIFADEITCLLILIRLEETAELVFPLVPDHDDHRIAIPPSFPLGLCVSRNERLEHAKKGELIGFLRDALPSYIEGNSQSIAYSYVALRDSIRGLVERAMPHSPNEVREEWLARSFRTGPQYLTMLPPHWRAVLFEVMAIDSRKGRSHDG